MMTLWINELLLSVSEALDTAEQSLLGVKTKHSKRVAYLCLKIAELLGLSLEQTSDLCGCAVLHDNALTEYILSERAAGNDKISEINLLSHCIVGEQNANFFPFIGDTTDIVRLHHENVDGSGPFGCRESEIPLGAAIVRIADGVDAMFSMDTPSAQKSERVRSHVEKKSEIFYPKNVAEACLQVLETIDPSEFRSDTIDSVLKASVPKIEINCSNQMLISFAFIFAKIIDYKSVFTRKHSMEIAKKVYFMADFYGYDDDKKAEIYLAAALHDLGKLKIDTSILEKPGKLTSDEFEIIKTHVSYTYEALHNVHGFEQIAKWAGFHHEKLDGSGYPFGKKAADLDRISRLMACIDIYQAVSEERPYHAAADHKHTMKILYKMAKAGLIDADIVADMGTHLPIPQELDRHPGQ